MSVVTVVVMQKPDGICKSLHGTPFLCTESHYTAVGRADLALFSHNYVTAGISINIFMVPLRC